MSRFQTSKSESELSEFPLFSGRDCYELCQFLVEQGVVVDDFLYEQGASFGDFEVDLKQFSADFYQAIVIFALEQTQDSELGRHLGIYMSKRAAHLAAKVSHNARSLGEALYYVTEFSEMGCAAVSLSFDCFLPHEHKEFFGEDFNLTNQYDGAIGIHIDPEWALEFSESQKLTLDLVKTYVLHFLTHFGIQSKSWDNHAINISSDELQQTLDSSARELLQIQVDYVDSELRKVQTSNNLRARLKRYLLKYIGMEMPTLIEMSEVLCMSSRQLQKGLAKESTSFQKTLDSIRVGFALKCLEKHFKVDEFLRKIGFQNQQSFLKFFKKEIGTSPAVYRKKFQVPSESVNHSNLN